MASTATTFSDMAPQPRVEVFIDDADLDPAAHTITVLQLSKWGTVNVRNATRRSAAGGFAVFDYEVPPGVSVTYRVEQFDDDGVSLGFALNMAAQVDIPVGWAVISDPLVPANALLVRAEAPFADVLKRSRPTAYYRAGHDTIALSGMRSLLQQVNLRCFTDTAVDREMLAAIVGESMILVRTMPQMRLPGSFYASVPDEVMDPFGFEGDVDEWDLVGNEITRPSMDVVVPVYTWQDIIDYYPTWADLIADRATWLDVLRNPPPTV